MRNAIDDHATVRTVILRGGMRVRHLVGAAVDHVFEYDAPRDRSGITNPEHRREIGVVKFAKITYFTCANPRVTVMHEFSQSQKR